VYPTPSAVICNDAQPRDQAVAPPVQADLYVMWLYIYYNAPNNTYL